MRIKNPQTKTPISFNQIVSKKRQSLTKIPFIKLIYLSIAVALVDILAVIALQSNLPPQVPLFYALAQGEDQLSSSIGLVIPGVFSLAVILINLLLASFSKNRFFQGVLVMAAFMSTFLSAITTLKIFLLVGSF